MSTAIHFLGEFQKKVNIPVPYYCMYGGVFEMSFLKGVGHDHEMLPSLTDLKRDLCVYSHFKCPYKWCPLPKVLFFGECMFVLFYCLKVAGIDHQAPHFF